MAFNMIIMNRGDSYSFDLTITDYDEEDDRYILKNKDVLYFGLMDPGQPFEHALVKKRYTKDDIDSAGNLVINIYPSDTLDLIPGVYYYAVKLHKYNDDETAGDLVDEVITVINKTRFVIND